MTDTGGEAAIAVRAPATRPQRWRLAAIARRTLLVTGQTLLASWYMLSVLPYHGATAVEKGLTGLFGILFAWISIGFWTAVFGFVLRRFGGDRRAPMARCSAAELAATPLAHTAVVMPIYHEPVTRSLGGLRAIYQSLERTGRLDAFEFFILSDSRDPEVWLAEQAGWRDLVESLDAAGRIHYRRRTVNLRYKSGNIADFLRRWGRNYDYLVVLDADSLMSGQTLVRMVQLMQLAPRTGILQTVPTLINARSPFARVQQFANNAYGPLLGSGLASITLGEAAYWGHNAIIRTTAFMRHCGLAQLRGFGLFNGPILSHDFAEAAYMGRAGFDVWMEPALGGSFEESPPSLVDELSRDRRWAKGNLQHLWLLFARGIRFAHRLAFANGIMAYLSAPLWFAFLVLTTIETTRFVLWPIDYFPSRHTLFPLWPEWHPEWAIGLAGSTLVLLFLPKLLAIIDIALTRRSRDFGGILRLSASVITEIVVSTLLAPIRMLAHTRYVVGALLNVSLHWGGQNRTDETRWRTAFVTQAPGMLIALGWSAFAYWLKPLFFLWSLPVAIPLVLAAPTSVLLSRTGLGERLRRAGLLLVPEERHGSPLLQSLATSTPLSTTQSHYSNFELALIDPRRNALHRTLARQRHGAARRATLRTLCRRCLDEGPDALTMHERSAIASDREALDWLHRQVWQATPASHWGRRLESRIATS